MSEISSSLSAREAAEISGFSARHIQSIIKKGKLSATRDESGNYQINKAEFYRVFPHKHNMRTDANSDEQSSRTVLEMEIQYLKKMLDDKNKQNEFLYRQLETASTEKTVLLETLTSNQKLLEYSSNKKRKKILGLF
jgi:hypothetical protein